jgi:hypothetical protein
MAEMRPVTTNSLLGLVLILVGIRMPTCSG